MTKPKPIFIVGVPYTIPECQRAQVQQDLEIRMDDYHVIVYRQNGEEPLFQTFYEKDFNQVKYEELKQIVNNYICP